MVLATGCMPISPTLPPANANAAVEAAPATTADSSAAATADETSAGQMAEGEAADTTAGDAANANTESAETNETIEADEAALAEEADPVGGLVDVAFQHVSFTYDTTIAHNWTVEYLANPPDEGAAPSFYSGPLRMVFRFSDYPAPLSTIEPVVYVYRVADISSQNEYKVANLLGALLAKSAPLSNYKSLPFLPIINEEQSIIAQSKYVQFQSGSGIRYLTVVGDASQPFGADSVWYTFQGLTSDNKFYIAAVFPLTSNMFPEQPEPDYNPDTFGDRRDEYLLLSKAALNLAPRSAFTPRLSRLDALVESIQIVEEQ
ncbi:MAG: hypothetical protein H6641_14105 [Caldilineaceae bacterium]|nr:hypothetical protein [Caldilineaceae bacterium]